MTPRLTLLGMCVLTVALFSAPNTLASTPHSRLIAMPREAHGGTVIYLSGGGFVAGRSLSLTVACAGGHTTYLPGPITDARGSFVAFRMAAPMLPRAHTAQCRVYAGRALRAKPPAGQIPARFTLRPTGRPLGHCATHMCVGVTAALSLTQQGAQGTVVITAWPGAVASAAVIYPGGNVKYRGVKIGWQGSGAVRVRIAKRIKGALKARVYVTATLGPVSGTAGTRFIVLPNR